MNKVFDTMDSTYVLDRLSIYVQGVTERIMRCFDDLEQEADQYVGSRFQELREAPGIDPENVIEGELEERALMDSVEYYIMMDWLKQQTLNNACAGLYHLWEKDLKAFLLRTIVRYGGMDASKVEFADFPRLINILDKYGFKFEQQPSYRRIDELRHVANVTKHGLGSAFNDLAVLRSDLFHKNEFTKKIDPDPENLEIHEQHFNEFADSVKEFWDTFDISLQPVS